MPVTFTLGTQFEVDANGGLARVATLTSNTAIALYSSAAAGIEARHLTNSSGTITGGTVLTIDANQADSVTICRLSDTSAVIGYCYGATHRVRVLTASGTTLTANAITNMTDTGVDYLSCKLLDVNKVIYIYADSVSDGISRVLTVSGTTITENAKFTFESVGTTINCAVDVIDTVTAIAAWSNGHPWAEILDISGTTITGNSDVQVTNITTITGGKSVLDIDISVTDADYIYFTHITGTGSVYYQVLFNSAGTLSRELGNSGIIIYDGNPGEVANCASIQVYKAVDGADPGSDLFVLCANETTNDNLGLIEYDSWNSTTIGEDNSISTTSTSEIHTRLFPGTTTGIVVWNDSTEAITIEFAGAGLELAPMTKPADIDAAGEFIYLALLEGGTPILTKISTDLDADGTTIFNPGGGDNIGVECGRFNSDVVWVAGQFNGTNVVEYSSDGGTTFTVVDDGTIGGIKSFVMGPDSDNRLLVFDEDNGDILETRDGGISWKTINASVTPEVAAIARLGQNVEESVFGNDGAANNSINYSVNSGDDLEDYQTGVYPNANATRILVN